MLLFLNKLPRTGTSLSNGIPESLLVLRWEMRPAMTTEPPSRRLSEVESERLQIEGELAVASESSGIASLTSWEMSRSMRSSEYTVGLMVSRMPVLRYWIACRRLVLPSVCWLEVVVMVTVKGDRIAALLPPGSDAA